MKKHTDMVHELIKQVSIEGCGGESGGVQALRLTVAGSIRKGINHLDMVVILTDAEVVDTGDALCTAARDGNEGVATFLLH